MWNIFESFWLLLTLAGISLVVVSIVRDAKPEWGYKPMLIPIILAGLAFGLDAAVVTDHEAIENLVATCKNAAVQGDYKTIVNCLSEDYSDTAHRNKKSMSSSMQRIMAMASIKKIRTQAHTIDMQNHTSELSMVVHLNNNSQYAAGGGLFYVSFELTYKKVGKKWYIGRVDLRSVNNSPMDWGNVP